MGNKWVIVEKSKENDGNRFKAYPVIDDANPKETIDLAVGDGEMYWLVQEISSKQSSDSQDDYCDCCRHIGENTCPGTRHGCWEQF